jgi:hypothetical protein
MTVLFAKGVSYIESNTFSQFFTRYTAKSLSMEFYQLKLTLSEAYPPLRSIVSLLFRIPHRWDRPLTNLLTLSFLLKTLFNLFFQEHFLKYVFKFEVKMQILWDLARLLARNTAMGLERPHYSKNWNTLPIVIGKFYWIIKKIYITLK